MNNSDDTKPIRTKTIRKSRIIVTGVTLGVILVAGSLYFFGLKPLLVKPLGSPLDDQEKTEEVLGTLPTTEATLSESDSETPPFCGDEDEWLVLMVGTDYREADYTYGLADAIRILRVDFSVPQINVVALPRALLIENSGPRLNVDEPIMLNQAYLFGTSGMGHFSGSGYGAGALAETIQENFGIRVDHYLVVDFSAFKNFIYLIGGVKIDLPQPIYINESEEPYFPAGVQILDGEKALQLARARAYTSDNLRIDNQTLLLQAISQRLKDPEVLKYLPELFDSFKNMILTDASIQDIQNTICLVNELDNDQILFFNPGSDVIESGRVFIPTMNKEMEVFLWDQDLVDWVNASLWAEQ